MKLERNEIDSDKETRESRNYDTLFGNGLANTIGGGSMPPPSFMCAGHGAQRR